MFSWGMCFQSESVLEVEAEEDSVNRLDSTGNREEQMELFHTLH